jgi:hypothetical protein
MSRAHRSPISDHREEQGTSMTTATPTTTETTATAEAAFTVAADMIAVERIHAAANVRSGTLPNIPSLAESIRREGVLTAITVDRRDDGDYELVAGFRRLAAVI